MNDARFVSDLGKWLRDKAREQITYESDRAEIERLKGIHKEHGKDFLEPTLSEIRELPLCACAEFYNSHHPECPAKRAFEALLRMVDEQQKRDVVTPEYLDSWIERAQEAEEALERVRVRLELEPESATKDHILKAINKGVE